METLEQLKAELEIAKEKVWIIEKKILSISDKFIYHLCILSYGSKSWITATNPFLIQKYAYEYGSGEDGLLKVYTNNPDLDIDHGGCLDVFTLEELPEDRRDISKSEAFTNTMMKGAGF